MGVLPRVMKKTKIVRRLEYSEGVCHQGANIGAKARAVGQIFGASVLLGAPETLNFFLRKM